MGILLRGVSVPLEGLDIVCPLDDPRVPRTTDGWARTTLPSGLEFHTVHGRMGKVLPGMKVSSRDLTYAVYQAHTSRDVSWHLTIDTDGSMVCSADALWTCWHSGEGSGTVNKGTYGVELVQENDGSMYDVQLRAAARFARLFCEKVGIPFRTPYFDGKPYGGRLAMPLYNGVFGHRNVWSLHTDVTTGKRTMLPVRGPGDPTDHPFLYMVEHEGCDPHEGHMTAQGMVFT